MIGIVHSLLAGVRSARAKPPYLVICILVLGVSSGAMFTIIAIADAVLFRMPTAHAPEQLTFIRSSLPGGIVSCPDFLDLEERATRVQGLFAYDRATPVSVGVGAERITGRSQAVSGTFFETLGIAAVEGRVFTEADDRVGTEAVAMVAEDFARKNGISVGRIISINTRPFRVIGTVPADYVSVVRDARPEIWVPLAHVSAYRPSWLYTNRGSHWLRLGGRIAPGELHSDVKAELDVLADGIAKENTGHNYGVTFTLASFPTLRLSDDAAARTTVLLGGIVAALFALAFTNFFALTLIRLFGRRREIALRRALGARGLSIAAWLLGELGIVTVLGLVTGITASAWLLDALRFEPHIGALIASAGAKLDFRAVGLVAAITGLAALVVWVLLLRVQRRDDIWSTIKEGPSAPRSQRLFLSLLAAQLALAFFLLTVSAAFAAGLWSTVNRSLPIRATGTYLVHLDLRTLGWFSDHARVNRFHRDLQQALSEVPGVNAVGLSSRPPLDALGWTHVVVGERDPSLEPDRGLTSFGFVGPGYFSAIGLPLVSGREFEAVEIEQLRHVAIVNRAMVNRYWPDVADPLGLVFRPWSGGALTTIVGVVDDALGDESEVGPRFYLSYATTISGSSRATYAISVEDTGPELRQRLTAAIAAQWPEPGAPVPYPIEQHIAASRSELVTTVRLVLWITLFATLVTACGLYFFSAYTAALTRRDAAIRLALGATLLDLMRHHIGHYRRALLGGTLAGAALVAAARPALTFLDLPIQPPGAVYCLVALVPLVLIAIAGLCAPLWSLRRLDVSRTLSID